MRIFYFRQNYVEQLYDLETILPENLKVWVALHTKAGLMSWRLQGGHSQVKELKRILAQAQIPFLGAKKAQALLGRVEV